MARKKRRLPEQFQTPVAVEDQKKVVYKDDFQSNVGKKVERFGKQFEGKGRNILYAVAAIAVLAVLIGIFYAWNRRNTLAAETALGKAIETSNAEVTDSPSPGTVGKTFKTEKERAETAINEFQAVADKYNGAVEEKARYFIAVNQLLLPEKRSEAEQALADLSQKNDEVGELSKFALAQAKTGDGKLDEAAALYKELQAENNPILARETIDFELAKVYEKQGKKDEASTIYFDLANLTNPVNAVKTSENEAAPIPRIAQEAKERLEKINPEKAREVKQPDPSTMKTLNF